MLELPHVIVGAALASKIPQPLISLPLALASHFLIDLIPHWNPALYRETKKFGHPTSLSSQIVIMDIFLSLGMGNYLASRFAPDWGKVIIILAGCFLAVLPDVVEGFYFYLNYRRPWLQKLIIFQHEHQGRAKIIPGIISQVITSAIFLYFTLSK